MRGNIIPCGIHPSLLLIPLSFCFMLYNILFESGNKIFLFFITICAKPRDSFPNTLTRLDLWKCDKWYKKLT